jgi:hypothetical protein
MKKLISTLIALAVLSVAALPAVAQTRTRSCSNGGDGGARGVGRYDTRYDNSRYRTNNYRNDAYRNTSYRNSSYNNGVYSNDAYRYGQNRSTWDQHRDKITTAGGAVGGAILGGLIGGKKGAVIGAITGGAGAAVYTYKIRDRNRRY